MNLGPISVTRKTGKEPFRSKRRTFHFNLLDFWQWSVSDLVSNATRGRLAEYIVAKAMGVPTDGVRNEWDAYDLQTDSGLKIEVKSAGYIQSWNQKQPSPISINVRKTRAWSPKTGKLELEPKRHADVYIFALLAHMDQTTIDPLDLDQWRFYVLPTSVLNNRTRSQHSITLRSLESLSGGPVSFAHLHDAVSKLEIEKTQ